MKRYFLYLLLFLFSALSFAQQGEFTLRGTVKTKEFRKPIVGVDVYILGGMSTQTNAFGEFQIRARVGDMLIVEDPDFESVKYRIRSDEEVDVLVEGYELIQNAGAKKELNVGAIHKRYIDSAVFYKKKDINKSLGYVEKSLAAIAKTNDSKRSALSFATLGDINLYYKQYDLAIANYKTSIKADPQVSTRINLAKAYQLGKQFENALSTLETALKQKGLTVYQQTEIYEGMGDAQSGLNNYKKAIDNYQAALKIAKDNLITPKITDLNSKIAEVYSNQNDVGKAEEFYSNSLNLARKQNAKRAVQEQEKVADFYNSKNLYDKEISLRQSNLQEVQELKEEAVPSSSSGYLEADSITPQKINYKIANAFIAQDKYDEAIPYLQKSINEADEKKDLIVQKDATRKLSEVYRSVGDFNKALESYQNYVQLVDELYVKKEQEISQANRFNRDITLKQSRISSLEKDRELSENRYELAVKEQQLSAESNKKQQIIIYALIFGLVMTALMAYLLYRNNKQQKTANNILALKSLRSQMNPHFIFNALNSVNSFIASNDERSANKYLTDFSTLMRAVLENSEEDFIPLQKEIELLQLYIRLEHSRFQEKFEYQVEVDQQLGIDEFNIPPMLLQPYIENAIWHGLRYKKDKGYLKVLINQTNKETVQIVIEDNGIGREKSASLKTEHQKKQKSKAMGNIKKRIAILNTMYKDKVEVQITDLFEDGSGTRVVLTLKKD